ncbi:MAG: thioredoxin family protein [Verrucomicrobiia bacterium]
MRAQGFIVFSLIAAVWAVRAEEKLPVLKAGINTYSNVIVTTVTATDIYFTYAGGMGNVKLKQLSPELQKHFGYDPQQAGEAEQKQAAANAQYHDYIIHPPAPRPRADESAAQPSSAGPSSKSSQNPALAAALNQARSENKMVLLDFTGSDWCGWCIKFDHDVLSTDKFTGYANSKLVLVKLDFPRHKEQDAALKQANQETKKRFGVNGFPTFVLLNSAGKELGRQVGYAKGGPDAFIAELDGFGR